MKLIEVVVGMFVLVSVLLGGTRLIILSNNRTSLYFDGLKSQSQLVSLYNYVKYLPANGIGTGYISFETGDFHTGDVGDFYYQCDSNTGNLIEINTIYSGVFCFIDYKGEKIYSYKLENN